ncbi:ABC transporter permease [Leifsonia sp. NPDC058248]|uniref:ABC transporter permease n=1 Tax=Leifsonia sp. NPDC058248 TaxID=3346402 RepID=UPI0036DA0387
MSAPQLAPHSTHTPWRRAVALAIGAAAAVALVLIAFVWPTITSSVKDVPIAVAGTSAQVATVEKALDQAASGAFDVTAVSSRSQAVDRIRTRDVYGAIVLGDKPEVLTASANGLAVSQILNQIAGQLQTQANAQAAAATQQAIAAGQAPAGTVPPTITVGVTDVVPLASTDARGLGLTAASFPLVLGGLLGGILISLLVAGVWRRLAAVTTYAVVGGLGIVAIMQGWFGVLQGSYWVNALAVGLAMFATASFIVGMNALIGRAGIAVGSVVTMLVGNPLSSAAQPLQFTVAPWGAVGQWFVPGASSTLVRDLSYFPQADTTFPWLVLAGWSLFGVLAMLLGHFRNQVVVEAAVEEDEEPLAEAESARVAQPV